MITSQELRQIICEKFLQGDLDFPIDESTLLLEEGICDSLGLVQLAADIESRSDGLRIHDQDITHENFGSIGAILRFLESSGHA